MAPKLVDNQGNIIFEFESDADMCNKLLRLISQAKYGDYLRKEYTLNPEINSLARAILKHAKTIGVRGFEDADGYYPSPPEGVSWYPKSAWCHAVDRLIFDSAPDLNWWNLSREEKQEIVQRAFYPHKLSTEAIDDTVDDIDYLIERYRKG